MLWFDYLNVIDVKTVLAPLYNKLGIGGRSQNAIPKNEFVNIDAERLAVRLEALELQKLEMEKAAQEITNQKGEVEQMAEALEERQRALDDKEVAINALGNEADARERNITANAINLNNMPPANAVAILEKMDDELAISVLKKVDQIAVENGTSSIVPFWMSLMTPDRVAELQRKMAMQP